MTHIHSFQLEPPRALWSTGVCECGETRQFRNFIDDESISWRNQARRGYEANIARRERGRPRALTHAQLVEAKRLIDSGMPRKEVAAQLNVTPPTLRKSLTYGGLEGPANGKVGFDDETVREIRRRYAEGGVSYAKLGEEYGVARENVYKLVRRLTYRDVE